MMIKFSNKLKTFISKELRISPLLFYLNQKILLKVFEHHLKNVWGIIQHKKSFDDESLPLLDYFRLELDLLNF